MSEVRPGQLTLRKMAPPPHTQALFSTMNDKFPLLYRALGPRTKPLSSSQSFMRAISSLDVHQPPLFVTPIFYPNVHSGFRAQSLTHLPFFLVGLFWNFSSDSHADLLTSTYRTLHPLSTCLQTICFISTCCCLLLCFAAIPLLFVSPQMGQLRIPFFSPHY